MNPGVPRLKRKADASRAWIFRLALGGTLIGLSVWGVALCRGIFRASLGPGALPGDSGLANLGAWAAWALFFCPLAVVGVVTVWSTLRKMSALDQVAIWLSDRAGLPDGFLVNTKHYGGIVRGSEIGDPNGLENLSAETVERLQRIAASAATILGGSQGYSCWVLESLDWPIFCSFRSPILTVRFIRPWRPAELRLLLRCFPACWFSWASPFFSVLFRKENSSWLVPLRVFTYMILSRRQAGERARRAGQHPPDTKKHPSV